ncbi:type II toxin-antitoxin system RelE/ParE family toxin [Paraliomyxa miuraensis]|uniref:type II toxin-antitoxin system RelE/ParE family toxin n=1 Tax=Paraliomyxa miuraensis TaxID=376150 RepID=UPI002252A496|nr:type II toxin-antitoxin system RelE/ParE family toxin [Paraliomyxa miuraensis]MCX4244312.1 type II toxin-antitoxin system RelE/ParE family toxin [Paraliomyxa miuraensis]
MRVVLVSEARLELREATEWYAARSLVTARRFVDEFKRVKGLVADAPMQWAEILPGVRRALFRKFPFALIYSVEGGRVRVLAVKHHKRRPLYWLGR